MIHEQDTLAFHKKERPGTMYRDLSEVALSAAGQTARWNSDHTQKTDPEDEALEFYFLNHVMAELETQHEMDEPLGEAMYLVERYHEVLNRIGTRMFHYILITTTRESRHLNGSQYGKLISKHGSECNSFTKKVASHAQNALFDYHGSIQLGPYLAYLKDVFGLSWSGAYGGPKWAAVTDCLRACVAGETSIEMMLDTSFTLAHNNGPIFNKGFQYDMYDSKSIYTILDCQAAGQIPNLIKSGTKFCSRIKTKHAKLVEEAEKILGFEFQPWVDWDVVQALATSKKKAHMNYESYKYLNQKMFSNDAAFAAANADMLEKIKAAKDLAAKKKAEEEKLKMEISPGVWVKKMEQKR